MNNLIEEIADLIVELAKERDTGDMMRAIYSVYMDVALEVGERMRIERDKDELK